MGNVKYVSTWKQISTVYPYKEASFIRERMNEWYDTVESPRNLLEWKSQHLCPQATTVSSHFYKIIGNRSESIGKENRLAVDWEAKQGKAKWKHENPKEREEMFWGRRHSLDHGFHKWRHRPDPVRYISNMCGSLYINSTSKKRVNIFKIHIYIWTEVGDKTDIYPSIKVPTPISIKDIHVLLHRWKKAILCDKMRSAFWREDTNSSPNMTFSGWPWIINPHGFQLLLVK